MLKTLCKNGYLVATGIGRGTHYKLNETYSATHANAKPNAPVNAKPKDKASQSNNLNSNNIGLTYKDNAKPNALVNAKPNAPVNDILNTPANATFKAQSGRNKNLIIKELFLFCSVWKKINEMARHIGKTPKYVSRHLIPEMLKEGLLIREYPDNHHHPAQRYRTKPKNGPDMDGIC